ASISPPRRREEEGPSSKRQKLDHRGPRPSQVESGTAPNGLKTEQTPAVPDAKTASRTQAPLDGVSNTRVPCPYGVVKRTWASSHDRSNDVKIEEVLQPDRLRKAVLSSFQWDHEWLFSKVDPRKTDLLFVVQAKTDAERDAITAEGRAVNPRIKLCFPPMRGQVNCMHSKLMLLFYDDYLRVVVPSANLTPYDWGDDGRMENTVFMVDLPQRTTGESRAPEDMTFFGRELCFFLETMQMPDHLLSALLRYDFSGTNHLAFVHTAGGAHYGSSLRRTGFPGLARAVHHLGLATERLELDIASSSLGALSDDFLAALHAAARGEQRAAQLTTLEYKTRRHTHARQLRIHFPTHDTVVGSFGGEDAAGTICLQGRWYAAAGFPRALMRDYRSSRPGLLSHNKLWLARGIGTARGSTEDGAKDANETAKGRPVAWAYVGSHNLSESAWGRMVKDRGRAELKLNCRNWECGVLIPVLGADEEENLTSTLGEGAVPGMDVFRGKVDIPFEWPGEEYGTRKPWLMSGE
ncbi:MAG: hypothetical protein INR71_05105, partial [Terriglobus roseus]|nr:hypothetical protein [Terriglobus roseus]